MKRSASASFDKEGSEGATEQHSKKITKSVQPKKSSTKLHDDADEYPSPIRVKKESQEVPQPLVPLTVNEGEPTEKELAAAKAARIRLGYEKQDLNSEEPGNETPLKCPTGPEPTAAVEVEYIPTEKLTPVENVEETVNSVVARLNSKDWVEMCTALNSVRQLTIHNPSECLTILPLLVPVVLKLFKNPRSSVCKTAVLCLADLLQSQKDAMLPYLDEGGLTKPSSSVLCQLFLKASSDKRFVMEEVQKVLAVIGRELHTIKLTQMLIPYASKHKNPKVRGKAGTMLASVTDQMTAADWKTLGIAPLLKTSAVLITDKTPEAREAARIMILKIHSIFQEEQNPSTEGAVDAAVTVNVSVVNNNSMSDEPAAAAAAKQVEEEEEEPYLSDSSDDEEKPPPPPSPWQLFCEEHLTSTQAIAVLKVQLTGGSTK